MNIKSFLVMDSEEEFLVSRTGSYCSKKWPQKLTVSGATVRALTPDLQTEKSEWNLNIKDKLK